MEGPLICPPQLSCSLLNLQTALAVGHISYIISIGLLHWSVPGFLSTSLGTCWMKAACPGCFSSPRGGGWGWRAPLFPEEVSFCKSHCMWQRPRSPKEPSPTIMFSFTKGRISWQPIASCSHINLLYLSNLYGKANGMDKSLEKLSCLCSRKNA